MKNRDVNKILTLLLFFYGYLVNFQLMWSMVISFVIVLIILSFTFINEDIEEMININPAFNNEDEGISVLLCVAFFMVLTILFNKFVY